MEYYILATKSLAIQKSQFPPTGNAHWLHTLNEGPVTHLALLVQPFRMSLPLLLSPIAGTRAPVIRTARVPGPGWSKWGILSHTEASAESHPSSGEWHALSDATFTTCSGQVTLGE